MNITVHFHSYFKELTGCAETQETLLPGCLLGELLERLRDRFPRLAPMKNSTLVAVGLDYQSSDYPLRSGDEVSLFPPVQGG